MFIFQTPPQMLSLQIGEKGLKMSLCVFARRSSVLDQTGADGQEAPGGACRQHGQVPLRGVGQPHAHHPLAQERQRLQGRAAHGRHQGQPGNSRFGLRRSCLTPTLPIGLALRNLPSDHRAFRSFSLTTPDGDRKTSDWQKAGPSCGAEGEFD